MKWSQIKDAIKTVAEKKFGRETQPQNEYIRLLDEECHQAIDERNAAHKQNQQHHNQTRQIHRTKTYG